MAPQGLDQPSDFKVNHVGRRENHDSRKNLPHHCVHELWSELIPCQFAKIKTRTAAQISLKIQQRDDFRL
jgi:hypothetical protein